MKAVFADTAYYLALLNSHDELHDRAVACTVGLNDHVVTTTWVLTELLDALCQPASRPTVIEFVESLQVDPLITLIPATQELFDRSFDLFAHRLDKEWSLTDCVSCVVMQEHGLTDALTSDHHFEQMGFNILL